jgi:hypothetical protein
MTKDKALDLALEALAWVDEWRPGGLKEQAITAIKQALTAPVQERNFCERCGKRLGSGIHTCTPPAAQRQWVGLTDEEHTQIAIDSGCMSADWVFYGAAVERKVKEKNF